jgi:VIT1/CCC1 family predicted Fe2+/Mn2+ transporter
MSRKTTPFSTYLREIVYDPMSSTVPIFAVVLFGLANLVADGLSMGLGSFLSLRAQQDVERGKKSKSYGHILNEKPLIVGGITFIAFIIFGAIPLLPYFFLGHITDLFPLSIAATAIALLLLGILRATVTKRAPLRGIMETLLVGGISSLAAYLVGSFFRPL